MTQTVDVTGLSAEEVRTVESIVYALRRKPFVLTPRRPEETTEEWIGRIREWIDSHPKREIVIDDDRETIYEGRGE
jgi:hypothetical protein